MAKVGCWFSVALVSIIVFGVVMRYVVGRPLLWPYEVAVMLGVSLYVLGFSYAQLLRAHITVDLIYAHLPSRARATIDILGGLFMFLPVMILLILTSWDWMWRAWAMGERLPFTGWFPPAGPLRTMVVLGFTLFFIQGLASIIRDLHLLIRNKPLD
jgi:TRAP-type mannitol/chloroaromatic compound transport system permease small subunit